MRHVNKLDWSHRYLPFQGDLWTFGPYQIQELSDKEYYVTAGEKPIGEYTSWEDATRAVAKHLLEVRNGPKRYP
jgi:hypothetical protein